MLYCVYQHNEAQQEVNKTSKTENPLQYISLEQIGKKLYFHIGDESVEIEAYKLKKGYGPMVQLEIKLTIPDVNMSRLEIAASSGVILS